MRFAPFALGAALMNMFSTTSLPSEQTARELARWLAPYIAEALHGEQNRRDPSAYDLDQCRALARELGVNSLHRAEDFFNKLAAEGAVDSVAMAGHLSVGTPRNISSAVTTPIKRISRRLGLGLPWDEDVSAADRTVWRDRNGIASRMLAALREENRRRFPA